MPLLRLTDGTVFDPADGAGVLLDGAQGVYFELNQVATLMLEAALRYDTAEEAARHLAERIDAGEDTLREGIGTLAAQLSEKRLVEERPEVRPGERPEERPA
ncbi:PqqD family protein [Streptomyces sp. ODS28]|uniref:PqqD family protein n=1 Tax=Streptomyces sp. ODS28 TaxID=3136688 RepID=UPI0031EA26CC